MTLEKTLTVVLCAGLLAPLTLHAENAKHPGKKAQTAQAKMNKPQATAQRGEKRPPRPHAGPGSPARPSARCGPTVRASPAARPARAQRPAHARWR